jgi:nucleoside-diphosphate-sugar epimerase
MPTALIIGGTGLIGQAAARRLLASDWEVVVTGRTPEHAPADLVADGVTFRSVDRDDAAGLAHVFGDGVDLLVDCICYTPAQATALLPLVRAAGSTVMISSKAVYADAAGNHSNSDTPPDFGGPIRETQATVAPNDIDDYNSRAGYGANKVAAEHVLLDSGAPVTVLRPSKVHGVGAVRPREWYFVRRILDRRPYVLLAHRGTGTDHTTAATNTAALIETVAGTPGRRILNSADPDAPSGLEIARTIARLLDHRWDEILVDGPEPGRHPWDAAYPIVLDSSAAEALGYRPVGDYAATVAAEVSWLLGAAREEPFAARFDDEFFASMFDYAAEDAYVADA